MVALAALKLDHDFAEVLVFSAIVGLSSELRAVDHFQPLLELLLEIRSDFRILMIKRQTLEEDIFEHLLHLLFHRLLRNALVLGPVDFCCCCDADASL